MKQAPVDMMLHKRPPFPTSCNIHASLDKPRKVGTERQTSHKPCNGPVSARVASVRYERGRAGTTTAERGLLKGRKRNTAAVPECGTYRLFRILTHASQDMLTGGCMHSPPSAGERIPFQTDSSLKA